MPANSKPKLYNRRHPERSLLYQTVAEHYESWLALACEGQFEGQGKHQTPKLIPQTSAIFALMLLDFRSAVGRRGGHLGVPTRPHDRPTPRTRQQRLAARLRRAQRAVCDECGDGAGVVG